MLNNNVCNKLSYLTPYNKLFNSNILVDSFISISELSFTMNQFMYLIIIGISVQ